MSRDGKAEVARMQAGDRVTFSWILRLWMREVTLRKEKLAREAEERERRRLEELRKNAIQEEVERRVSEMRKMVESLGRQLDAANQTIEQNRTKIAKMEKELETAAAEALERERQHQVSMAKLRDEMMEIQYGLSDREAKLQSLRQEFDEAQAVFRRAEAEHSEERKQLQETVRRISSELHEAVVLAKYMREAMLKCKRDAASSISPAKFAQLIAQLEDMRDQLRGLQKDYNLAKDSNSDLQQKLEKNRRRLELERQFLPLIRHARGPLGPKQGLNDILMSPPQLPDLQSPGKMQRSQSAVHISKGYSLSTSVT